MIIVSNTSPILNLSIIKQWDILEQLYQRVLFQSQFLKSFGNMSGDLVQRGDYYLH